MTHIKNNSDTAPASSATDPQLDMRGTQGYASRGDGFDFEGRLREKGADVVIEDGARLFHPENIAIGARAFVGHGAHIDGYHNGHVTIGAGSWIGAFTFIHGAGGVTVGRAVGIGPRVTVLTSEHVLDRADIPILHAPLAFAPVVVEDGADIGAGAVILPGVTVGRGAAVGAGAVVTKSVAPFSIVAGNPAREIRKRT